MFSFFSLRLCSFWPRSCNKVSRTWRKIICEDSAAVARCEKAEQALKVSHLDVLVLYQYQPHACIFPRIVSKGLRFLIDVFSMSFASFSGVKKLLEATALPADQRCGCFQGGLILHADSGLLQHPVFLIHPGPGRQQARSSI